MSEQQRVFLAVGLCLGILLLWQWMTPKPPKSVGQPRPPVTSPQGPRPDDGEPSTVTPNDAASTKTATAGGDMASEKTPESIPYIPESRRHFETKQFTGELSNRNASLTRLELNTYNERPLDKSSPVLPVSLVNVDVNDSGTPRQARILWDLGNVEPPRLDWTETDKGFALAGKTPDGVETRVQITPRDDVYALDYVLAVDNGSDKALPVGVSVELSLNPIKAKKPTLIDTFAPPVGRLQGACSIGGDVEREDPEDLEEDGNWKSPSPVEWVGIDRQYFIVALVPTEPVTGSCEMSAETSPSGSVLTVTFGFESQAVRPGATWERRFTLYMGPKRDKNLAEVSSKLPDVIDYSWGIPLGFIARPMVFLLNAFQGFTGSWGVAIMLLTLLVKLLLFPVTYKSMLSMRRMQLLKPELDKLKKQFEGDRERQQMEQMKLFKEKGVNPLGGCLPMLMQMPIWVALYRTLWSAVDLYQQEFLWLGDLTATEPYPVMAFLVGGLMFLQQRMSPTTTDSQQAKMMMYMMPVMFTFFMLGMPSGLVLYIMTNSVLTIFQQMAINRRTATL